MGPRPVELRGKIPSTGEEDAVGKPEPVGDLVLVGYAARGHGQQHDGITAGGIDGRSEGPRHDHSSEPEGAG